MYRALILCHDFPPLNSIGAQRPYSWFKHFKENGIYPVVITKNWESENAKDYGINSNNINDVLDESEDGTIIRVNTPIILPDRMLIRFGPDNKVLIRKSLTFIYKCLSFIIPFFDKNYALYKKACHYLSDNNIDIVITTGEPFILFRYGYLLKKKYRINWIADYRDMWSVNHVALTKNNWGIKFQLYYEKYFEMKYIRYADLITTVDPHTSKNKITDVFDNINCKVIYNGFDSFYSNDTVGNVSTKLVITHAGTLTPGQRIEFLLRAVMELYGEKKIKKNELEIKLLGIEFNQEQLKRIKNNDFKDIACFLSTTTRLNRQVAIDIMSKSDYLLAFTEESKYAKCIFAKVYDYLSVKRQILVIPSDVSVLDDFVTSLGAGIVIKEIEQLKQLILDGIEIKKQGDIIPNSVLDIEKAIFYTRESQARLFAEIIKEQLS